MSSDRKRRICILVPTHWEYSMGGAEYQAKLLTEYLIQTNEFEIFHLSNAIDPDFSPKGYKICRLGRTRFSGFIFDCRSLLKILNRIKPEIIYQQVGCAYTGVVAYYSNKNNCNLVWQVASDPDVEPWTGSLFKRFSIDYIDKLVLEYGVTHAKKIAVQTETQANLLNTNYARKPAALIRNFHPISTDKIDKSGQLTVLWVANVKKLKQPQIFIRLARDLMELDVQFLMMGELQGKKNWHCPIIEQVNSTPNMKYMGRLPQKEVNRLFATSHLLVNTSKYEGFSNTFIQAWMRKVPVISYNVDPDKLLSEKKYGACAYGDYDLMLRQLKFLIEDEKERTLIGKRAQEYAIEHHSDSNLHNLVDLF